MPKIDVKDIGICTKIRLAMNRSNTDQAQIQDDKIIAITNYSARVI